MNIEQEARAMGWRPQEEFKGDLEKWVDAETFVERGKQVLPILRRDNERLHGDVNKLVGEVGRLQQLLSDSQESIQALKEFHDADTRRQVKEATARVKVELAKAQEEGDHAAVVELTDQLVDLKAAEKEAAALDKTGEKQREAPPQPPPDYSKTAWFQEWSSDNAWYGRDVVKTAIANMVADHLRMSGEVSTNRDFLDKVVELTEEELGKVVGRNGDSARPAGKVEGARGGGGGGHVKGYESLPADAKETCNRQAKKLVGEGRAFKTEKDWQSYYASQYYAQE